MGVTRFATVRNGRRVNRPDVMDSAKVMRGEAEV